jgi:hypothetical protein
MKIKNYESESEVRMLFCRNQLNFCESILEEISRTSNPTIEKNTENKNEIKTSSCNLYNTLIKPAEELSLNKSPKFEVISGTLRKYIELKMESIWKEHPIKEVILGPNCNTKIEEFNEFLKENGMSCKAVKSNIENRQ